MSKHNLCSDVFWVPRTELLSNNRLSNFGLPDCENVENRLCSNVCWDPGSELLKHNLCSNGCWVPGCGILEQQFVF